MDIADINSCQLATFVGNQSIGVMDSAVSFSPSNNSAIVNGQIHFGSIGILPHPPALLLEFANFNRGIVLATGSFDFRDRTQGVIRPIGSNLFRSVGDKLHYSCNTDIFCFPSSEVNSPGSIENNVYSTVILGE
jgi:hypothetical protein